MTDERMRELFAPFASAGRLEKSTVIIDKMTGAAKGFGFVNYSSKEDAMNAIETMNGYQVGSKYLKVSFKK